MLILLSGTSAEAMADGSAMALLLLLAGAALLASYVAGVWRVLPWWGFLVGCIVVLVPLGAFLATALGDQHEAAAGLGQNEGIGVGIIVGALTGLLGLLFRRRRRVLQPGTAAQGAPEVNTSQEREVLRLVRDNTGETTASEVALSTSLSLDDARRALDDLAAPQSLPAAGVARRCGDLLLPGFGPALSSAGSGEALRTAAMHAFYLRNFYVENKLAAGTLEVAGRVIDLSAIKSPAYVVSAINDHIVPWEASFKTTGLVSGPVRFVLSSGGHIAGIVNPPGPKAWYQVAEDEQAPSTAAAWRNGAERRGGSWWEDWPAGRTSTPARCRIRRQWAARPIPFWATARARTS